MMRLEESPSYAGGMENGDTAFPFEGDVSSESPSVSPLSKIPRETLGSRMSMKKMRLQFRGQLMASSSVGESASCPLESHHQGKTLLDTTVTLPVDAAFSFIFLQPEFMLEVYADRKAYDVTSQPWQNVDERRKIRTVTYTLTLPPSNMGPKVASVTERQVLLPHSQPGNFYVVEVEVANGGIPYADSFYVSNHYCLTREADGGTRVVVWSIVKYKKTVWGFMKGMIEKNTYSGAEAMMVEIANHLEVEAEKINNPGVIRRRRGTNQRSKNRRTTKTLQKQSAINESTKSDEQVINTNYKWTIPVMLTMLVLLGVCNVFLYKQLFQLENLVGLSQFSETFSDDRYFTETSSWDSVASILKRQDQLHARQMAKWRQVLTEASQQLQQVQESIQDIAANIPDHRGKLLDVLIQSSKSSGEKKEEESESDEEPSKEDGDVKVNSNDDVTDEELGMFMEEENVNMQNQDYVTEEQQKLNPYVFSKTVSESTKKAKEA